MAQQVRVPGTESDNLCLVLGTHMEGNNQLLQIVLWLPYLCILAYTPHIQDGGDKKSPCLCLLYELTRIYLELHQPREATCTKTGV